MAKTGQYLHGRELHDHELHKLDKADRAQMTAETNFHIVTSAHSAAWENFGSKRNQTTTATAPANDEIQTGLPSPSDFALSPMTTAIVGLICSPILKVAEQMAKLSVK